jgi:hypothetical protein
MIFPTAAHDQKTEQTAEWAVRSYLVVVMLIAGLLGAYFALLPFTV